MSLNLRRVPDVKKVLIAGEGPNELGGWAKEPEYRDENSEPGILETLLRKKKPDGWTVSHAKRWKDIKKFRAGEYRGREEHNVLGVCLDAKENGCDVIAFSRDSDGDSDRETAVRRGIEEAQSRWSADLGIIGNCAVPCIEGWILAILGTRKTEDYSREKIFNRFTEIGIPQKSTAEMVAKIEQTGLATIAEDAHSLRSWLETAQIVLSHPYQPSR